MFHLNSGGKGASARFEDVRVLMDLRDVKKLRSIDRDELTGMVQELSREVLASRDLTCGPDTAARFFNRKRSWIYEAMSRPGTPLQRSLQKVAAREAGGLLFRLSDLVRIRRSLFRRPGED